ncbi:DUF349 domain-containing protein [Microbacterium sp.]|uniref:DUF349 domain-containing protein n=1 Tax=Microbacterium sp. TaxID=51671 RepID=UPI003A8873B4
MPPAGTTTPTPPSEPWGRVGENGTVEVREGETWRVVGEYPDGTPEEALAYFERKFADLDGEVRLLEERHRRGGASAADLRSTAQTVRERVTGAAAVGDLAGLEARLTALEATLVEATAEQAQAAREAVAAAVVHRTAIVEQIEAIAARDPKTIQWKQTTAEISDLFALWQTHQSEGPRLPKSTSHQLWKRFRDARSVVDRHRRDFYSTLDEQHKSARAEKTRLIERAEALASKGEVGIADFRDLLERWKRSGRAVRKADDALWARFKAAGDALYGARAERERAEVEESKEKIEAKRALLTEAQGVAGEKDLPAARTLLTGIQRRWDDIGRVFPRDVERGLDDDLRKIEQALRSREDQDWKSNNPETKARQNDMTQQLHDAIAKLEQEAAAADSSGDASAAAAAREALATRKAWLAALGG